MSEWYQPGQIKLEQQNIARNAFAMQQAQQQAQEEMAYRQELLRQNPANFKPRMISEDVNTPLSQEEITAQYPPVSASPVEQAKKSIQGDDYQAPDEPGTSKTQSVNKLVQPEVPEPTTMAGLRAQQFWQQQQRAQAQQMLTPYAEPLKQLMETGDPEEKGVKAIVGRLDEMYQKTGNPIVKQYADIYRDTKFTGNGYGSGNLNLDDHTERKIAEGMAKTPYEKDLVKAASGRKTISRTKDKGFTVTDYTPKGKITLLKGWTDTDGQPVVQHADGTYWNADGEEIAKGDLKQDPKSSGRGGFESQTRAGTTETGESVFYSRRGGPAYTFDNAGNKKPYTGVVIPSKDAVAVGETYQGDPRSPGQKIADVKAGSASQAFITKQLDASQSFISTIDNNIDQLKRHIDDMAKRHNLDRNRVMNMGVRKFNQMLVGDADINIYDMLTSAISTENAKLQAGGAGSVAAVAEGARTSMKRIHDDNMPVSEMLKLMDATRLEGDNRIKALEKQRDISSARVGQRRAGPPVNPKLPPGATLAGKDNRNGKSVYKAGKEYYYEDGTRAK